MKRVFTVMKVVFVKKQDKKSALLAKTFILKC
ncbi:hypothetical protein MCEGE10_02777 [Flavobacteriaceae bacterium]